MSYRFLMHQTVLTLDSELVMATESLAYELYFRSVHPRISQTPPIPAAS